MIEYAALASVFALAFIFESYVTGQMYTHRQHLSDSKFMRWWALITVTAITVVNTVGFLRLHSNYLSTGIDFGNYVQAMFAACMLSLMAFVAVFHRGRWGEYGV